VPFRVYKREVARGVIFAGNIFFSQGDGQKCMDVGIS
jgi:hypothetical protein